MSVPPRRTATTGTGCRLRARRTGRQKGLVAALHVVVQIRRGHGGGSGGDPRRDHEGRHALAAKTFHGKKCELYQRYHEGMEDQLGALGLILSCIVLWNTRYMNAALEALRAQGYLVLDEDVARLSPFVREHLNVVGNYTFALPDLGEAGIRPLRDPDVADDDVPG